MLHLASAHAHCNLSPPADWMRSLYPFQLWAWIQLLRSAFHTTVCLFQQYYCLHLCKHPYVSNTEVNTRFRLNHGSSGCVMNGKNSLISMGLSGWFLFFFLCDECEQRSLTKAYFEHTALLWVCPSKADDFMPGWENSMACRLQAVGPGLCRRVVCQSNLRDTF